MGVTRKSFDAAKYGRLLVKINPKPVEDDAELDRYAQALEEISIQSKDREMTREELTMSALLTILIREYEDRAHPLPDVEPL